MPAEKSLRMKNNSTGTCSLQSGYRHVKTKYLVIVSELFMRPPPGGTSLKNDRAVTTRRGCSEPGAVLKGVLSDAPCPQNPKPPCIFSGSSSPKAWNIKKGLHENTCTGKNRHQWRRFLKDKPPGCRVKGRGAADFSCEKRTLIPFLFFDVHPCAARAEA